MLIRPKKSGRRSCVILGTGRSNLSSDQCFSNAEFVRAGLSLVGRQRLFRDLAKGMPLTTIELEQRVEEKFVAATGIHSRYIFAGTLTDLATLAAREALERAMIDPSQVSAIFVGTNTPDEYNIANGVKQQISAPVSAYSVTLGAACPVGAMVVFEGWKHWQLDPTQYILVIAAERATTLASADVYQAANLFGDAAGAFVLGPGRQSSFDFFSYTSDPFEGKERWIRQGSDGFTQDGPAVHKYVGAVMPGEVARVVAEAGIDPQTIDHLFTHQASAKTNSLFLKNLQRQWPTFRAKIHGNVATHGNTSAASTLWMIGQANTQAELTAGQSCLVVTFGAGMSYCLYLFRVPERF